MVIGSYGGEGWLSGRCSSEYEASRRGMDPRVAAAPYPLRLMLGIPGKCFPYKESYSRPELHQHYALMDVGCARR